MAGSSLTGGTYRRKSRLLTFREQLFFCFEHKWSVFPETLHRIYFFREKSDFFQANRYAALVLNNNIIRLFRFLGDKGILRISPPQSKRIAIRINVTLYFSGPIFFLIVRGFF